MDRSQYLMLMLCLLLKLGASSLTVRVVRRVGLNNVSDQDTFSNPTCSSSDCPSNSHCSSSCCMCKCNYNQPNFLVKVWECKSNPNTEQQTKANCSFSIRPDNEPLEVLLLTEQASGKVKFTSNYVRIDCDGDAIVDQWQYLNAQDAWIVGHGDIFTVGHNTVGGPTHDKKDLTFLQWNRKLDAQYAGLLIRVSLYCKDKHHIGCLLAKINGTHTYDRKTPQQPITTPPAITTSASVKDGQSGDGREPTKTPPKSTTQKPTEKSSNSSDQQLGDPKSNEQSSSSAVGTSLGVIGGIVALICILILLVVVYRRRKTCLSWRSKESKPVVISDADIENYQDPVYAELPETNPDFDNPTYCDPTNDNFTRRSKLDPLPGIPGMEPSYQPLNELTRTIAEPTPPPLPPISYPNGEQNEAFDYENPSTDATESCGDYDNPPQATDTDTDYPTNESSDYDNPPVETNKEYTLPADGAQVTVEFMPGMSADDPITDAHEYFVLEPTDNTSM